MIIITNIKLFKGVTVNLGYLLFLINKEALNVNIPVVQFSQTYFPFLLSWLYFSSVFSVDAGESEVRDWLGTHDLRVLIGQRFRQSKSIGGSSGVKQTERFNHTMAVSHFQR